MKAAYQGGNVVAWFASMAWKEWLRTFIKDHACQNTKFHFITDPVLVLSNA
jgi:hypothetical protein